MAYIIKEKFSILDLVPGRRQHVIGIVEQETYLAGLYRQYLERHSYGVHVCPAARLVGEFVYATNPDVLVVNPDMYEKPKMLVKTVRQLVGQFPRLRIVTVGYNTQPDHLRQLMTAGIASHMNRKLSRPQDLVVIVKSLLSNN